MTTEQTTDLDARIVELEARLSWLESTNDELSQALYKQQTLLDEALKRLASLGERVRDLSETVPGAEARLEDDVPPHY